MFRNFAWALFVAAATLAAALPADAKDGKVEVHWIGHAAFKLTSVEGKVILIDPFITGNPKLSADEKNLEALGKIDLILVTHGHGDHVGDSIALAKKHKVPVYGPAGLNQTFSTLGLLPQDLSPRMNKTGTITPFGPNVKITQVRAEHSSEFLWKNPATGKMETHVGGEPVGWIVEFENGFKVYHMGDTGLFGDMRLIGEYYKPDMLLIPIGGHYVLDPKAAAMATRDMIRPKYALPMHYGTNPLLKGTPAEYAKAMGATPVKVLDWKQGQKGRF